MRWPWKDGRGDVVWVERCDWFPVVGAASSAAVSIGRSFLGELFWRPWRLKIYCSRLIKARLLNVWLMVMDGLVLLLPTAAGDQSHLHGDWRIFACMNRDEVYSTERLPKTMR